ncbi:hypothetical protein E2C01_008388 [Portunus trituberculatus]|uniref:Uncharacterized protein n=1 Tax=Portunus trituberculatus TaxID=210409 RepID=A0A5B7D1M6_PORTR|nr:hypothetical protein [Portunus trituberculatus]
MLVSILGSQPRRPEFECRPRRGKWENLLMCSPCSPI